MINQDGYPTSYYWHLRKFDLSAYAGKTISQVSLMLESCTQQGGWSIFFGDIALTAADGTVFPIYNGQTSISLSMRGSDQISGAGYEVNYSDAWGDAEQPMNTTHYYHGDHLGSSRLMTAGGGWPVWQAMYLPFGYEYNPQNSVSNFKFTGQEHDDESNLDHFWFRQYSSAQDRWLRPDPAGLGAVDLTNPQSWNRYAYVANNPVSFVDPLGLNMAPDVELRDGEGGGGGCPWFLFFICGFGGDSPLPPIGLIPPILGGGGGGTGGSTGGQQPTGGNGTTFPGNPVGVLVCTVIWVPGSGSPPQVSCTNTRFPTAAVAAAAAAGAGLTALLTSRLAAGYTANFILVPGVGLGPAGTVTVIPSVRLICAGGGIGAAAAHNFSVGPIIVDASQARAILSGLSLSGGYQTTFLSGVGGSVNGSGSTGGWTFGPPGVSASLTYSGCWNY